MNFKDFFELAISGENPPGKVDKGSLKPQEKQLLRYYLEKGDISHEDCDDVLKMLDSGWLFQDALNVAKQQANHRKEIYRSS